MNKINPFFFALSQQIHKMYEKVALITQIWLRAKLYFTCISNPWYPIYRKSINHHGGMHNDGHLYTDGLTNGLDPFLYSQIPLKWSGE